MLTRICGIPCEISVTDYEDLEFQVLDRNGRRAPWLERKLDKDDVQRIERELKTYWKENDE